MTQSLVELVKFQPQGSMVVHAICNSSNTQGQLTLKSVIGSNQTCNSSILLTAKNEKDSIKNLSASFDNTKFQFFRHSRIANSAAICSGIMRYFKLIQDFMVVLVSCKYERHYICETSHVLLAGVSGGFSPGTPAFAPPTVKLNQKKKKKKKKKRKKRHYFLHYKYIGILSTAQGQLTCQSNIRSNLNSNSSEIL